MEKVEQAIIEVRNENRASFSVIVDHFQLRLRAYVASIVASREMVDEIVQTAFLFAYQNIEKYEIGTNFYAWLRAIARNYALEELRREVREQNKRKQYFEHIVSTEILADEEENPQQDRAVALFNCLQGADPENTDLLKRRYTHGQPLDDIAEEFGRTISWVKIRLFRIREALRKCIEDQTAEEVRV